MISSNWYVENAWNDDEKTRKKTEIKKKKRIKQHTMCAKIDCNNTCIKRKQIFHATMHMDEREETRAVVWISKSILYSVSERFQRVKKLC